MKDLTVNRFRTARGKRLRGMISRLAQKLNRPVRVLDIGGRADYWDNVGLDNISEIRLLNNDPAEFERGVVSDIFVEEFGDARALTNYSDKSVDLVHSNSVIEHVGLWPDMCAFADEALRVGVCGWVQTPAFSFPIEPHYRLPFMHWFGAPVRRRMLDFSRDYRKLDTRTRRNHVDRINLLSRNEVEALFPGTDIYVEWVVLPKSYTARWGPEGVV